MRNASWSWNESFIYIGFVYLVLKARKSIIRLFLKMLDVLNKREESCNKNEERGGPGKRDLQMMMTNAPWIVLTSFII